VSKVSSCILVALLLGPAAAAAEDAKPSPSLPPVKLSGTIDAYYGLNLGEAQTATNAVRAYDGEPGFQFNYAQLSAAIDPAPAGLRLDVAFGGEQIEKTVFGQSDLAFTNVLVEQAFVSLKLGPTVVDAGRFVTPAGFERYAARDNWLYTRGLLFKYAIPRAHEGVRVTVPLDGGLSIAGYLANGNDLRTNDTGGADPHKTAIVSARYDKEQTNAAVTIMYTKPPGLDDTGFLADFVVTQGFGDAAVNLSADYGKVGPAEWYGAGVQGRLTIPDPKLRITGRFEWVNDKDGYRNLAAGAAKYWDMTVGVAYPVATNAELRGEIRYDHASDLATVFPGEHSGTTATLAAVAWF
jgi:hypothetical protein